MYIITNDPANIILHLKDYPLTSMKNSLRSTLKLTEDTENSYKTVKPFLRS